MDIDRIPPPPPPWASEAVYKASTDRDQLSVTYIQYMYTNRSAVSDVYNVNIQKQIQRPATFTMYTYKTR